MLQQLMNTIEANLKGLNDLCGTAYKLKLEPQMVSKQTREPLPKLETYLAGGGEVHYLTEAIEKLIGCLKEVDLENVHYDVAFDEDDGTATLEFYRWVDKSALETSTEVFARIYRDITSITIPFGQIFVGLPLKGELLGALNKYLKVQEALK